MPKAKKEVRSPHFTRNKRSRYFEPEMPKELEPPKLLPPPPAIGSQCPSCGVGVLTARAGRYGPFLGCSSFPKCRHTHKLRGSEEGTDEVKRPRRGPKPKARLEMETADTFRLWSTDTDQAPLRAALATRVALAQSGSAPRADWLLAGRNAERTTAVFSLADHDALIDQLQAGADETAGASAIPPPPAAPPAPPPPAAPTPPPRAVPTPPLAVQPVPSGALSFFRGLPASADETPADAARAARLMRQMPARLLASLLGFQRHGVQTLLRWRGRGLLADEMGLGKTIQALACLGALRPWPTLLIVPASLRLMWAEELERWLPELLCPADVRLIASSSDALHQDEPTPKLVVTSFRLATILRAALGARQWKCVPPPATPPIARALTRPHTPSSSCPRLVISRSSSGAACTSWPTSPGATLRNSALLAGA